MTELPHPKLYQIPLFLSLSSALTLNSITFPRRWFLGDTFPAIGFLLPSPTHPCQQSLDFLLECVYGDQFPTQNPLQLRKLPSQGLTLVSAQGPELSISTCSGRKGGLGTTAKTAIFQKEAFVSPDCPVEAGLWLHPDPCTLPRMVPLWPSFPCRVLCLALTLGEALWKLSQ